MGTVMYRKVDVDVFGVFYRETGPKDSPTILLLHGFPTAGHMFRDLIPQLVDRFRLVAPDLPGFGQSDMPAPSAFSYTFESIANVISRFTEVIGLHRFAMYVFDYGAPVGFRLAVLGNDCGDAIRMPNGKAEAHGCAIIEDVHRESSETDYLGEAIDDVRDILEGVSELAARRHVGLTERRQVGSNKVKSVRELRDQIAEHVAGCGKTVQ